MIRIAVGVSQGFPDAVSREFSFLGVSGFYNAVGANKCKIARADFEMARGRRHVFVNAEERHSTVVLHVR